jgi:hypothetical protein
MFCGLRINLIQISAGGFASGGKATSPEVRVGPKTRPMRCSKQAYSITWSARSNMEVGIVRMSTARLQGHHKM